MEENMMCDKCHESGKVAELEEKVRGLVESCKVMLETLMESDAIKYPWTLNMAFINRVRELISEPPPKGSEDKDEPDKDGAEP